MKTSPVALWLWYQGDLFRGYQRQLEGPTVQQVLEETLIAGGYQATPAPSGRTDRGVHARMQVVSFRPKGGGQPEEIRRLLEASLPPGVGVAAATLAHPSFHAQWSANAKEYRYRLLLGPDPRPEWEPFAWRPRTHPRLEGCEPTPERVAAVLGRIVGTRDFIAFHEKSSVQKPRTLARAQLVPLGDGLYEATLQGEGFARYQVRYLVGSAVAVAAGVLAENDFVQALERGVAIPGLKAPGHGLILWEVGYPPEVDPFAALRAGGTTLPTRPPFTPG